METVKTVLVVDDDPAIRRVVSEYLRRHDCAVLESGDGQEAVVALRETKHPVDLIITDVYMPLSSGMDLVEEVRRVDPHVPIIVMTGHPRVEDAVHLFRAGISDYVAKPFNYAELDRVIQNALSDGQAVNMQTIMQKALPDTVHGLAGYRIIEVLGRGSSGVVYLVDRPDESPPRQYALKILNLGPEQGDTLRLRQRFLREAETAAKLQHPHIVDIIDYGIAADKDIPYLVMEYLPGSSVEELINNQAPLDYRQKTAILAQIAEALAVIHEQDICHRDLKPGNIIVDDAGNAKLTDFGLVHLPGSALTGASDLVGTPAYLAPESFAGDLVTPQADLFALGVVAYEFYLGQRPFDSVIFATLQQQIQRERPLEPRQVDPAFPLALQHILARLLKKQPKERFARAEEVAAALHRFRDEGMTMRDRLDVFWRNLRSNDWR